MHIFICMLYYIPHFDCAVYMLSSHHTVYFDIFTSCIVLIFSPFYWCSNINVPSSTYIALATIKEFLTFLSLCQWKQEIWLQKKMKRSAWMINGDYNLVNLQDNLKKFGCTRGFYTRFVKNIPCKKTSTISFKIINGLEFFNDLVFFWNKMYVSW